MKLNRLIGIAILLIVWEVISLFFPPVIFPSVEETLSSLFSLASQKIFWLDILHTLSRAFSGFFLSLIIGSLIGIFAGLSNRLYEIMKPIIVVVENIPPISWVIVAIIWFGIGNFPPIFAIMSVGIPIIATNVANGVKGTEPSLIEMAHAFGVQRKTRLKDLYLPAISGYIFSAISIGLGLTWRVVIMAEFFGSMSGIGYKLNWARYNVETGDVFAYILVIAIIGLISEYLIVEPIKKKSLKWQK